MPHVSVITKLEISDDGSSAKATREIDGGLEIVECELPAVFTTQKGLNEPRYPSLPGIMKAKKKPLEVIDGDSLIKTEKIEILSLNLPPSRKAGKITSGDVKESVSGLIKFLHDEVKIV